MDNDHGITGELREWAQSDALRAGMSLRTARDQALAIADRIDAAYQKAEDEWKAKDGQTWLRGYGECHAELMEGNEIIAADLERAGWACKNKERVISHATVEVTPHIDWSRMADELDEFVEIVRGMAGDAE